MKIEVDGIKFNLLLNESNLATDKIPVIFLHGFTGCAEDWLFIFDKLPAQYFPIAIDLIGHGETDSPEDTSLYSSSSIIHQLDYIFTKLNLNRIVITGYSMGGRAAISYCMRYPEKIIAAILESTTAGIENIELKKERVEFDFLLAEKIKEEGVESFIDYWMSTPLFKSLKNISDYDSIKNKKIKNSIAGLTNSLYGFSTGLMPSYWDRLKLLNFPALILSGSNDSKYTCICKNLTMLIKNATHKIVENAGHNVHLEKPDVFTNFVSDFLNTQIKV